MIDTFNRVPIEEFYVSISNYAIFLAEIISLNFFFLIAECPNYVANHQPTYRMLLVLARLQVD